MRKTLNVILAVIMLAIVSGCAFVAPRGGYSGARVDVISVRPAPYYVPAPHFSWRHGHRRSHRHW